VKALLRFFATLGPVGYAPFAPATAGSAVTALVGWFIPAPALPEALTLLAVGTIVAGWIAGEAEKDLGHDAKPIVVDEVIGQSVALLLVPRTIPAFMIAFLLFRVFDVWKPFGAHAAQRFSGGVGIVADDVIAGITACAVFHLGWGLVRMLGWVP